MLLHKNIIKFILHAQKIAIMKIKKYALILLVLVLGFNSCSKDDEDDSTTTLEIRDRAEQYLVDLDSIEQYLSTHFFNYEEFEADEESSTFQVVLDTIAGDNSDKTSLMDQLGVDDYLRFKTISDSEEVEYKLYYLMVREGGGEQSTTFADDARLTYKGSMINDDVVFDSTITPGWLPLHYSVQGFRETMVHFKGYGSFDTNPDGTSTYNNFGIGAMFLPSGLAYFSSPSNSSGINAYSPLIFTFQLINVKEADDDNDGISNFDEDLDGDRNVFSDDTDEDGIPNFADADDDGDGTLTKYEDLNNDEDFTNDDDDNDGVPNYLDKDSAISNQA